MALIDDITDNVNNIQNSLNANLALTQDQSNQFKSDGFLLPATFSADGNGLPSSKVNSFREAQLKRNIISWFVPQFGIVKMYINPNSISYSKKKIISKDRTKGGYTLQYWGEELENISISGTTGSSGIEGINVLEEIYRAEQYAFDAAGLVIAANNANINLSNNLSNVGTNDTSTVGSIGSVIGSAINGILGMDSMNRNLALQDIPSLAQLAFTVEMYYNGWVYRGFFDSMTVNERADNFLLEYQISFIATQRRGYRTNYFAWARSANDGPSSYTTPNSFSGNANSSF